jgi:alginate O-acetyltransferase complex protein AlgI
MLFNSTTFIVFFVVIFALYYLTKSWQARKSILLIGSYLFYAAWNPPFILLLWLSTYMDFYLHKKIYYTEKQKTRNMLLIVSLVTNLGLLFFFKYGDFLLHNFQYLAGLVGVKFESSSMGIILPVGISFYTFQTLSCVLESYYRKQKPVDNQLDFALYVAFFPQLVAGPIIRVEDIVPQFKEPKYLDYNKLGWGLFLFTLGLFQKMVIADTLLSPISDSIFDFEGLPRALDSWVGVFAFSGQIFCDFAGYSTCAIGISLCLGFTLPDNFKSPYAALGFSDFWKRWHITLSTWLRDFLYIPLGGNKKGKIRTLINLMITMFLGGLWHGANWTFVIWGVLHGFYLIMERFVKFLFRNSSIHNNIAVKFLVILLTYVLICIAWVFFRAKDLPTAAKLLFSMFRAFDFGATLLTGTSLMIGIVTILCLFLTQLFFRNKQLDAVIEKTPTVVIVGVWAIMLFFIILTQGSSNAFIYFQF